ncbi:MAG: rod shape-determining protein RodA [Bacteroidales bacterium]|nr:rod shape-determining protein RodA [Bacteroidales bacterium]
MLSDKMNKYRHLDWILILCYLLLICIGWMNIYSSVYSEGSKFVFDFSKKYGMQIIWIVTSIIIAILITFVISSKLYRALSPLLYVFAIILLFSVIFLGRDINGSHSWFVLGPVSFQPAEISKLTTSLFLAYVMSKYDFNLKKIRNTLTVMLILLLPMLLMVMEKETGSALVYLGFTFMLYREGMSGWFLSFGMLAIMLFVITLKFSPLPAIILLFAIFMIIDGLFGRNLIERILEATPVIILLSFLPGIAGLKTFHFLKAIKPEYIAVIIVMITAVFLAIRNSKRRLEYTRGLLIGFVCAILLIFSVDFIFDKILQPHQRARIENLLGITEDLQGSGYNVNQSKIAIGSGGFWGKGYLKGTQTKYNFVPEQSTDFIFCTIGEEWGFAGSFMVIAIYLIMILRIIGQSEKQESSFTRIYGYCTASVFAMHVFINLGMTMGIMPVIGIPLPFISYGGSSMWSFTILLFIFIRLELSEWEY